MPQIKPVKAWEPGEIISKILHALNPAISFAEGFKASPSNITIGVNENVTIQVGNFNLETGNFSSKNWFFLADRFLTFQAEFLDGNPYGVWFVNFNPPTVSQRDTDVLITNATISLNSPPVADTPIQSTIIRINVTDTWVAKNLWWPEKEHLAEVYALGTTPLLWFLGALLTKGYGGMSGKILPTYYNVDILVKVKPYHAAKIQAVPPNSLSPGEIVSIPVLIENQGNYNDTFNFRVKTKTGYPLTLTNNGTITLQPGEQGNAYVGVAVPLNTLDTGTLHSITLEIFSMDEPNTAIASQRLILTTQGFYVSGQISAYSIGLGFFLILVLFIIIIWRRRVNQKISIPPDKPWKIPEEQQYLQELRQTDKKAYEQERIMMKDEYKSALLWYKDYRKTLRKKPEEKKLTKFLSTIFKKAKTKLKVTEKPEKKQKKKPAKPLIAISKKSEKPLKIEQKKKQPSIPAKDITLEKALAKIRKEQEKQLRKMNI